MTGINLLHVSAPGCHPQRLFQIRGINHTARHTSHFASLIWTLSLRITNIETDVCTHTAYRI